MQVFHDAAHAADALSGACVTIGNYDGVHRGHRAVLSVLREVAADLAAKTLVVTFRPHPAAVLSDAGAPPRLTSDDQQRELLESEGIDGLLRQPFDVAFAGQPPEAFWRDYLCGTLGVRGLVVGSNFCFGERRSGDLDLLRELATGAGVRVEGVEPIVEGGERISSSRIRALLAQGDVEGVEALLGRPFTIEGRVVRGDGRGRTIGFPTANIEPREVTVPGPGVYACVLRRDDELHGAVANVGRRPTFGARPVGVEAHVFDFDGDLYDERVRLAFLHRLRDERRFRGPEELVAQIRRDADDARALLAQRPPQRLAGLPGC